MNKINNISKESKLLFVYLIQMEKLKKIDKWIPYELSNKQEK